MDTSDGGTTATSAQPCCLQALAILSARQVCSGGEAPWPLFGSAFCPDMADNGFIQCPRPVITHVPSTVTWFYSGEKKATMSPRTNPKIRPCASFCTIFALKTGRRMLNSMYSPQVVCSCYAVTYDKDSSTSCSDVDSTVTLDPPSIYLLKYDYGQDVCGWAQNVHFNNYNQVFFTPASRVRNRSLLTQYPGFKAESTHLP